MNREALLSLPALALVLAACGAGSAGSPDSADGERPTLNVVMELP